METTRAKQLYYLLCILAPSVADAFLMGFYTIYLLQYLSLTDIGIQYAFWLLVLAIADFPTGALVDVWGARRCLILSYGLMMGGYLSLLLVGTLTTLLLPLFFGIHFFFAVSAAQESGTLMSWFTNQWMANHEDASHIREVFGRASALSLMASTTTSILGGFLAAYLTIELVFLGALLYCVLGALVATRLDRLTRSQTKPPRGYWGHTKKALSVLQEERRLVALLAIACLNYAGWFVVTYLVIQPVIYGQMPSVRLELPPLVTMTLEPLFLLVVLIALFSGARVIGYHYGGKLRCLRDINAAVLLFGPIPCLYLLLFLVASMRTVAGLSPLGFIIVGIFLIGLSTGFYNPHMLQFFQRLVPDDHRAAIWSLRSTVLTATTIVFTIAGGILLQDLGLEYGFLVAGLFGLGAWGLLVVVWYFSPGTPQPDARSPRDIAVAV
ncbi:MAG: MFS transporter [Candidatus Heimdallarchaeota archaeon]